MRDALILTAVLFGWIALNRWILPWFGIPTCMSGACTTPQHDKKRRVPPSGKASDGSNYQADDHVRIH